MKLSDYVVSFLKNKGVKHVFMITGGGSMHFNDSFGKESSIQYICNHHEQASAIAAECYARLTNTPGVCQVTTGPGGTNTLTGLIGAWLDSIPVIFISGQVKCETSLYKYPGPRQIGIQEINIIDIVKSVTKYAEPVLNPNDIRYHLEKAWYLAKSGRPGPVWLDVPLDVQSALINEKNLKGFDQSEEEKKTDINLLKKQVKDVIKLIKKAKRPIIIAGFGLRLSNSLDLFYQFIKKLNIPVLTSINALDVIWEDHRLYAGRFGLYGSRGGNFTIQNSDLMIVFGCRLMLWETGYETKLFASHAKKIIVDIDEKELQKPTIHSDIAVNFDVKLFMQEVLKQIGYQNLSSFSWWIDKCKAWQKKYPNVLPKYEKEKNYVNSYYFTEVLSGLLNNNDVIVTGNGTAFTGSVQAMKIKKGQRICINIGCAAMGYDLPAAIGAYFATKKKRIILITGDGSIQMNIQELQTIVYHKIPVKIFILNNQGYLAIRITQKNFFGKMYGTDKNNGVSFPDMQKIAKAYGIPAIRIKNQKNLDKKIKEVLKSKGPIICEIMMDPNQTLIPKLTTRLSKDGKLVSTPLEDMYPFLPRKEFLENMFIKSID